VAYYTERSAVASPFKEAVRHEGLHRTSMRTLASCSCGFGSGRALEKA